MPTTHVSTLYSSRNVFVTSSGCGTTTSALKLISEVNFLRANIVSDHASPLIVVYPSVTSVAFITKIGTQGLSGVGSRGGLLVVSDTWASVTTDLLGDGLFPVLDYSVREVEGETREAAAAVVIMER